MKKTQGDIQRLDYRPQDTYALDLEVFTMAELRRRGSQEKVRTTHRYEFHMLVCVTRGACTQVVDFKPMACAPGALLVLRAGQAHNFGRDENWGGWIVLFRPEFALPTRAAPREPQHGFDLLALPEHIHLSGSELRTVSRAVTQMREDARLDAPRAEVQALLRHQLHALLSRLSLLIGRRPSPAPTNSPGLQRFKRFQQLVDERFLQWHQVARYAQQLGYTDKSLARAVTACAGTSAKAFIAARIALEAKRLLVHTDWSVATIADKLGFDEATNFSKFFRREVACTPAEFRRRQLTAGVRPS